MARIVSFAVLLVILVAMSILFLWVMADFILPVFLALLLVVMFGPVNRWFIERFRGRVRLAALATTGTILLSVLVPVAGILTLAGKEGVKLYEHLKGTRLDVREIAEKGVELAGRIGWTLDAAELERTLTSRAQELLTPLVLNTPGYLGRLLITVGIMILSVYYFFADGPSMIRGVLRLSPLDQKYQRQLIDQFDGVSRAVVLAMLLAALAQGLAAGVGFFFAGVGSVVLLTVLSVLMALIPFIGTAAVWVPVCLWLAFIGDQPMTAIVLTAYCLGVVSMIDNVVRPYILQGRSSLHPL
ncbi:MAG: AI-2E family transporter, partial [Patescibacteria group bacterium]|nr:AI-2E family transporter [Patescibacteria group bacterium]